MVCLGLKPGAAIWKAKINENEAGDGPLKNFHNRWWNQLCSFFRVWIIWRGRRPRGWWSRSWCRSSSSSSWWWWRCRSSVCCGTILKISMLSKSFICFPCFPSLLSNFDTWLFAHGWMMFSVTLIISVSLFIVYLGKVNFFFTICDRSSSAILQMTEKSLIFVFEAKVLRIVATRWTRSFKLLISIFRIDSIYKRA